MGPEKVNDSRTIEYKNIENRNRVRIDGNLYAENSRYHSPYQRKKSKLQCQNVTVCAIIRQINNKCVDLTTFRDNNQR